MLGGATGGVFFEAIKNFLGPIYPLLLDDTITEVLINGPDDIFVEIGGKLKRASVKFETQDDLMAAVNAIAQSVGRRITEQEPRLDARLPDGSRVHVVIPPCARNGATVAIRKFFSCPVCLSQFFNQLIRRSVKLHSVQVLALHP